MAYKKVIKYDQHWNQIEIFNSVGECANSLNISNYVLSKRSKNQTMTNGFYYIIQDLESYFVDQKCSYCGKTFKCQKHRLQRKNIFCCKKCEGQYRKYENYLKEGFINCKCPICGKEFHLKNSNLNSKNNYCSIKCHSEAKKTYMLSSQNHQFGLKGSLNSSWKSDTKISFYGYRLIRVLDHPFRNVDDFVFEHRLIAEKHLLTKENSITINNQSYLKEEYIVHHLDFDRLNNNVNNLLVMTSNEHLKLHQKLKNDLDFFNQYCDTYKLNPETVKNNHLFNTSHYKFHKKVNSLLRTEQHYE